MVDKVIDSLANSKFDCMIKRSLFSYQHYIKPSVDNSALGPRLRLGQLSTVGLDIRADMKTAVL